jgi:hypothetical protein
MFDDEAIDCCLQVDDREEDAAFQTVLCELGEEALDGVKPRCRCGREVEGPAGMPGQPLAHLRVSVGCVVVDGGVDLLSRRHLRFDGVEEADELLVPHIAADDGAVEDVEGREQCRRAMTLVVVGHRPGAALLHWQAGLGAVERLDLALFINREDDGMGWRIDIETDDVAQLVNEARGGGEFELFHPVRPQAARAPDSLDGTRADTVQWVASVGGAVWLSVTMRSVMPDPSGARG